MSDAYVECLVKAKRPIWAKVVQVLLIILTVILALGMFIIPYMLPAAAITGVGAYLVKLFTDLEYEYLYLDKEIVVDKIMSKTMRKRVATYGLDRIEIMAPVKSAHLDGYKNRQVKVRDYSIRQVQQPDLRYAMFYEGGEKILLSPSEEMIKVLRNVAPRKVYND